MISSLVDSVCAYPRNPAISCTVHFDIAVFFFFTDSSLQASQQGTKRQGVTKEEGKRRIEAKESDTSTTRPRYETSFDE